MTSPLPPGTALVTGASSGIGEVYAEKLARRGYDLILVGRNAAKLQALATRLGAETGREVTALPADLAHRAGIETVEAKLRDDAAITLLVNNAGLAANGPLAEVDPDALTDMLNVNVLALTRLARAAAAAFSARQRGAIVNVASAMAFIDLAGVAAYGASKAYVLNLSLALDLELSSKGVQVQAVLPGYTRTPMIRGGDHLPQELVMDAADMVDAALTGLDRRELVTIPSLSDPAALDAWLTTRTALHPHLSLSRPAERYAA